MSGGLLLACLLAPAFGFGLFLVCLAYKYGYRDFTLNHPIVPAWVVVSVMIAIPVVVYICVFFATVEVFEWEKFLVLLLLYTVCEMGVSILAYPILHIFITNDNGLLHARFKRMKHQYDYNMNLDNYKVGDYIVTISTDTNHRDERVFSLRLHVVREEMDCSGVYSVLECLEYERSQRSYTQQHINQFVENHFNSAVSYDVVVKQGAAMSVVATPPIPPVHPEPPPKRFVGFH